MFTPYRQYLSHVTAVMNYLNGHVYNIYHTCNKKLMEERKINDPCKQTNKQPVFTNYIHASILIPLWLIQFTEYIWSMFDLRFRLPMRFYPHFIFVIQQHWCCLLKNSVIWGGNYRSNQAKLDLKYPKQSDKERYEVRIA